MTAIDLRDLKRLTGGNEEEIERAIKELFTYRRWTTEQEKRSAPVSEALQLAYKTILLNVPASPSRTRALNCLTDARMLANQAITFGGDV